MDAREFDFKSDEQAAAIAGAEFEARSCNPMEVGFAAGWKPWFEAMKRCVVVVKEEA